MPLRRSHIANGPALIPEIAAAIIGAAILRASLYSPAAMYSWNSYIEGGVAQLATRVARVCQQVPPVAEAFLGAWTGLAESCVGVVGSSNPNDIVGSRDLTASYRLEAADPLIRPNTRPCGYQS
jgi:hypothetical protein